MRESKNRCADRITAGNGMKFCLSWIPVMKMPHYTKSTLRIALFGLLCSTTAHAEWFVDEDTGCKVWGEHPQPIVKVHWSGDCVDGKASGEGLMEVFIDGFPFSRYEGEYKEGKAEGHGVLVTPDDARYEGEFSDNNMHGHGVIISPDGKRLEGTFVNGVPDGVFSLTAPEGKKVEIEFKQGIRIR